MIAKTFACYFIKVFMIMKASLLGSNLCLNYTTRPNRISALESNPTTAANMWFLTYRDKSPLQADDWLGFRDPDQVTYRKYVTMQDEQETAVERILDEYGAAGHDASLSQPWAECLATLFTPTRFPVHALQMCTAYLAQMAPAPTAAPAGASRSPGTRSNSGQATGTFCGAGSPGGPRARRPRRPGLASLFGVRSAQTVENAANSARHRILNEAGLAA